MTASIHRSVFESLGAYALGALPEHERQAVDAHLEECPICAEDAAALQRAASRLTDVVPALAPSPALRDRIMAVVEPEAALVRATRVGAEPLRARRPRRRFDLGLRWVAIGAALLVVGGVVGATVIDGAGGPGTRTLAADVGRGHAWVEMQGERARLVVAGMASPGRGKVWEMWIQSGNAAPRPASADLSQAVFVVGSGRVDIPARLQPGDRVMVTAERPGGSKIPTSSPVVITARV